MTDTVKTSLTINNNFSRHIKNFKLSSKASLGLKILYTWFSRIILILKPDIKGESEFRYRKVK